MPSSCLCFPNLFKSLFYSASSRSSSSNLYSQNDLLMSCSSSSPYGNLANQQAVNHSDPNNEPVISNAQHVSTSIQSLVLHYIERNDVFSLTDLCSEFTLPFILKQMDFNGETLCMKAARSCQYEILLFLLEMGSNLYSEDLRRHWSLVHLACSLPHGVEVLQLLADFLLTEYDEDGAQRVHHMVNQRTSRDALTPLHYAIQYNNMEAFLWLLDMGASPEGFDFRPHSSSPSKKTKRTSQNNSNKKSIKKRKKWFSLSRKSNNSFSTNNSSSSSIHSSNASSSSFILPCTDDLQILNPPLLWAVQCNQLEMVKILVERGASVDCKDHLDNTPLMLASERGSFPIVEFLVEECGSNIHAKGFNSFTALHYAASENHHEICTYLVQQGCCVNARDKIMRTPLHCACIAGHAKTSYVLVRLGADMYLEDDHVDYEVTSSNDTMTNESTPLKYTQKRTGGKTALDLAYECGSNAMQVAGALQQAEREISVLTTPTKRSRGYISSPLASKGGSSFHSSRKASSENLSSMHSYGSTLF